MNESGAAAAAEAASADRDAVTPALMAFGRRYLEALGSQDDVPMISMGAWRSHPQAPGMFVPLRTGFPPTGFDKWEEYRAIEALVMERPRLHRLITEPMNAPTDQVPDLRGWLSAVAHHVERYEAIHGSDERGLADLIDELADWFCRDADPIFVAKCVVGFTAPGPLPIKPGVTVRRATDEEVSAMLEMGVLNVTWHPNPPQVSSIHVDEAVRWVVTLDYSRPRFSGTSGPNPDDPTLSTLEAAANDWLAVLRILTPANVRLGPTFTTQLVGGITSGGWSKGYGQPTMFAWHNPATITPDTRETFVGLAARIRAKRANQVGIAHGLHRFSEATTRTSPTDRLVDLVIALESMFSKGPGAASYQVSRRASAMMAHLRLSAATVYEFLSAAYRSRSDVVHGGTPDHRNLAGEPCPVEEQVGELDRLVAALFRQILSSSSTDKPADFADKLISDALDSQRAAPTTGEPSTYEVTVNHESGRFSAVPPAENTSRVYGATLEQLRTRLANVIGLWTQTPCGSDQISFQLDDEARAASRDGA